MSTSCPVHTTVETNLPAPNMIDGSMASANHVVCRYVILSLGSQTERTSTVGKNLNPQFTDGPFKFHASDASYGTLKLVVWDYDRITRDDFLGEASIAIMDCFKNVKLQSGGPNSVRYKVAG